MYLLGWLFGYIYLHNVKRCQNKFNNYDIQLYTAQKCIFVIIFSQKKYIIPYRWILSKEVAQIIATGPKS